MAIVENKTQKMDFEKENNLETVLKDLDLENILETVLDEAVALKMLLSFNESDSMKDCIKDIGIKRFGDRHKIIEKIRQIKRHKIDEKENEKISTMTIWWNKILVQKFCFKKAMKSWKV